MAAQYPYVVIDNEAGLENLSRRIAPEVDLMIMVTDPSARGIDTVSRLHKLAHEMGISYKSLAIAVNRTRGGKPSDRLDNLTKATKAQRTILLPEDHELSEYSEAGVNLMSLGAGNPVVSHMDNFVASIMTNNKV
jgi:CO dehydrogenase maturation factor